jgi:hypothetical protein
MPSRLPRRGTSGSPCVPFSFYLSCFLPMPRDFITLSDMPQAVLGITCDLCQRREQFDVEALMREHGGDVKMPELLSRLGPIVRGRGRERSASMIDVGRCTIRGAAMGVSFPSPHPFLWRPLRRLQLTNRHPDALVSLVDVLACGQVGRTCVDTEANRSHIQSI